MSLTLKGYAAEAGGSAPERRAERTRDRKACSIAIPVLRAPPGHRVVLSELSVRGGYRLAQGSRAKVSVEAFLPGGAGAVLGKELGPEGRELSGTIRLQQSELVATGCGQAAVVRVSSGIQVAASERADVAAAAGGREPRREASSRAAIERFAFLLRLEPCAVD